MKVKNAGAHAERYAYIKYGSVTEEVERFLAKGGFPDKSGPDAFTHEFLHLVRDKPALVVAVTTRSLRKQMENVSAIEIDRVLPIKLKAVERAYVFFKLALLLIRFRPEFILCSSVGPPLWAAFIASKVFRSKFVVSVHNRLISDGRGVISRAKVFPDAFCLRRSQSVLCHGPYLTNQVMAMGVHEEDIVEFEVRLDWSAPHMSFSGEDSTEEDQQPIDVLYVGRIEVGKGVFDLLDACEIVMRSCANLRLVYAGDGAALDRLEGRINTSRLKENVEVLGPVPHGKVQELLRKSSILVAPTRTGFPEGRCMSVLEALMVGVPVIAPNSGPFPFLVKDGGNGLLYEPDSAKDLGRKLEYTFSNPKALQGLREGAIRSSVELANVRTDFGDALRKAFDTE